MYMIVLYCTSTSSTINYYTNGDVYTVMLL